MYHIISVYNISSQNTHRRRRCLLVDINLYILFYFFILFPLHVDLYGLMGDVDGEEIFNFDVTRSRPHSHIRHHHCRIRMYPQPYIHSYNSHHFHYNKILRYRHVLENHLNRWVLKDLRMYHRIHHHHSQSIGSGMEKGKKYKFWLNFFCCVN